jgi:hypothetical protein
MTYLQPFLPEITLTGAMRVISKLRKCEVFTVATTKIILFRDETPFSMVDINASEEPVVSINRIEDVSWAQKELLGRTNRLLSLIRHGPH